MTFYPASTNAVRHLRVPPSARSRICVESPASKPFAQRLLHSSRSVVGASTCARWAATSSSGTSSRRDATASRAYGGTSTNEAKPRSIWSSSRSGFSVSMPMGASRLGGTSFFGSMNTGRRLFSSTSVARHNPVTRPEPGTGFKIHFKDSKGTLLKTIEANRGDSILDLAHEHDIDLEGACEGSIACSTCHVILEPDVYDRLEEPGDDENDMLDMAFGLTDTSRLGCQVIIEPELDGMVVTLPSATRNMFVDGHKATAH